MEEQVYQELCQKLAKRGGRFPGMDIPEFYVVIRELFTPEEASVFNAIPKNYHPADTISANLGRSEKEISTILETMADKGLVLAGALGDTSFYGITPLDNIFDFQFMRGTSTEWDKNLAKLIHAFKMAVGDAKGPPIRKYPTTRVIPIDRRIKAGNTIHTYQQVASYIEKYDPLAVSTCYCRQEAKLFDENDTCNKPFETCIENCPTSALAMGDENIPIVNLDLCIGCGVCATGCPEEAIDLVERQEIQIPPVDQEAAI
jgi:NAD-dependent dihydropyrimidine dehydrogenase PreA subunit